MAEENEDFSGSSSKLNGGISLPGSTWTIGAMFSQSTGVPLKIPLSGSKMKNRDSFFPKLESIGKILQREGYQQELLIGSKAIFGGRDIFYKNHGDYQLNDYDYAKEHGRIPEDYLVRWSYEDEKLFQFAREDLTRLASEKKPFNLTMLTADTHFEDGYRCRLCRKEFGEQYADVMTEGNKLGLGVNLFSEEETLIEKYGLEKCISELKLPSSFMTWMSGITLTKKTLKHLAKITRIEVFENPDGLVRFIVDNVNKSLSSETVHELVLELKDKESGTVTTYPTELTFPNKNDPNNFLYYVDVDLKGKTLEDYEGSFYISIEGTEHYKIADFSQINRSTASERKIPR